MAEIWNKKYPGCMNRWMDNWDVISPMFKFSETARRVLYTTNAIESLNSGYRRLNRSRSVFPNDMSLLKALYLATYELTKKWTRCGIGARSTPNWQSCIPGGCRTRKRRSRTDARLDRTSVKMLY